MVSARAFHSATSLADGRVLVAGGREGSEELAVAETYDPKTGKWTPTMTMYSARSRHPAVRLLDGRVLVVGGGQSRLKHCEIFDPVTGEWLETGDMNFGRDSHAAVLLPDGRVLVVGGTGADNSALASVERYDPTTGRWEIVASMSQARSSHASVCLADGSVLVTGGCRQENPDPVLRACERLDPVRLKWELCEPLVEPRYVHIAARITGGDVLVTGGGSAGSTEIYFQATGRWRRAPRMEVGRVCLAAVELPDGRVLACGGQRIGDGIYLADVEQFESVSETWSLCAPMATARSQHEATRLEDGSVLVTGGTSWGEGTETRRGRSLQMSNASSITWPPNQP